MFCVRVDSALDGCSTLESSTASLLVLRSSDRTGLRTLSVSLVAILILYNHYTPYKLRKPQAVLLIQDRKLHPDSLARFNVTHHSLRANLTLTDKKVQRR